MNLLKRLPAVLTAALVMTALSIPSADAMRPKVAKDPCSCFNNFEELLPPVEGHRWKPDPVKVLAKLRENLRGVIAEQNEIRNCYRREALELSPRERGPWINEKLDNSFCYQILDVIKDKLNAKVREMSNTVGRGTSRR